MNLDSIAGFDLINPLDGLIGRLLHGRMHKFTFNNLGYCGMDVEDMLRRYHIRMWGRDMSVKDEIGFLVKDEQAVFAEYIMCRAGVPLTCKLLNSRHQALFEKAQTQGGSLPPAWTKGDGAHSFVDLVTMGLDAWLGTDKTRAKWYNRMTKSAKLGKTYKGR